MRFRTSVFQCFPILWFLVNGIKASQATSTPNVIIFLADDLGYGDLGYSGHPTSRTPNIDALAANSRIFTHFYVPSPLCSPSRAALLTGRYHMRSGTYPAVFFPYNYLGLPHNETTVAKLLKQQGYKTEIVGKWHLGVGYQNEFLPSNPAYGFDNYFGMPYPHSMCPCPICFPNNGTCLETCWNKFVSCPLFHNKDLTEQPADLTTLSERLVSRAVKYIYESYVENSPFFLFYSFLHIHRPHYASQYFYGKSDRGPTGDSLLELDWAVGEVVHALKQLNLLDNTLIWFTSDNGPSLVSKESRGCAGLLRCGKGTTWDGGVRVPTFVHWPLKISPGKSNALTSVMDILPTITSIVGIDTSNLTLDGVDISSVLFDCFAKSPREFFAIYPIFAEQETGPYAVIHNQYKAHFYTRGSYLSDDDNYDPMCPDSNETRHDPPLLYNLYQDPGERYNLGEKEEFREILAEISEWRQNHMKTVSWMEARTIQEDNSSQPCCNGPVPDSCDCTKEQTQFWITKYPDIM